MGLKQNHKIRELLQIAIQCIGLFVDTTNTKHFTFHLKTNQPTFNSLTCLYSDNGFPNEMVCATPDVSTIEARKDSHIEQCQRGPSPCENEWRMRYWHTVYFDGKIEIINPPQMYAFEHSASVCHIFH